MELKVSFVHSSIEKQSALLADPGVCRGAPEASGQDGADRCDARAFAGYEPRAFPKPLRGAFASLHRREMINWRGERLLDCLSTFTRIGSKWDGALKVWRNPEFMREAESVCRRWQIYGAG
jgi:hypothetical protein